VPLVGPLEIEGVETVSPAEMVMETVAMLESSLPSLALKVKESGPV